MSPSVGSPEGDLVSMSMPHGEAQGIIIDNPSGSWLTVYPLHDIVPPYTLQWSRDFPYSVASATVRYTDGPSGQQSSEEGDPIIVWLDSERVGASNGVTKPGSEFRPLSTTTIDFHDESVPIGTTSFDRDIIDPVAVGNSVVRIYSVRYTYSLPGPGPAVENPDTPAYWRLRANPVGGGLDDIFSGMIGLGKLTDDYDLAVQPRDLPRGIGMYYSHRAKWSDTVIDMHVRYALV